MMVYLNERDRLKHRELQKLSGALREMAVSTSATGWRARSTTGSAECSPPW